MMTEDPTHAKEPMNVLEEEAEATHVSEDLFRKKKLKLHTPPSKKHATLNTLYSEKSLVDI